MPTLYLIFAHLVADFVLQPRELVKWKFRNWKGIVFHAVVHFLLYLVVFFPYLPDLKVFLALAVVSGLHCAIDSVKIFQEKRGGRFVRYFALDQAFHLLTLIAAGAVLGGLRPHFATIGLFGQLYENIYIAAGLALLIFSTYTVEIIVFQFQRQLNKKAVFKPDYRGMLRRAIIFGLLYGLFMVFGVYSVAAWTLG